MLFFFEDNFIEVVKESCYKGILTVCCSSRKMINSWIGSTMGAPVRLHGQAHKWALHLPENQAPAFLASYTFSGIETVDRLTGPALAFAYDFVVGSSPEEDRPAYSDYGFCWPEQLESTERWLFEGEDPIEGEVFFVPIWTTPDELTRAPRAKSDENQES